MDQELQAECTGLSHAMETVKDALEVQEKEFSQVQLENCVGGSTEIFHLMQPLVLDEIDMEEFNKIAAAMVITNQDIEPTDLPTALTEIPVTEAIEHDRLGILPNVSHNNEAAAFTPMVPSLTSHPGRRRAKSGEEKVTQDKQILETMIISLKIPVSDACPTCERYSEKNNDDDVNDEEPGQELNSSWRDECFLHIDMARKATHKYQEDASGLLPVLPGNKDSISLSRLIVFNKTFAKLNAKYPGSVGNWTSKKRACTKQMKLPHLTAIVKAEFQKGSRNMFYRTSFDSDEVLLSDFLQKSFNHMKIPDPDVTPRGISKEKKEAIVIKLCPIMPFNRHQFWLSLPVTAVPDLTIDEDDPYEEE
ncbi:hypothetical protein QYM36_018722 [Artemia franciscana]|uniref:Uncharacterized protein n=1 Tax=Artemia franciscana TaxID=6661 RepID=A0AA88KUC2_ARTSF|nr:hypothetical protein QYM36_018722 [Artemia franciscana]